MRRLMRAIGIPVVGALVAGACSSNHDATPVLATACVLKSDCTSPLVCVLGVCHQECAETSDCPAMTHCRQLTARGYNGCAADNEFKCAYNSDCRDNLKCSVDGQCRSECRADVDCLRGQTCDVVRDIGVCVDPSELSPVTLHLMDRGVGGPPPLVGEAGAGGAGGGSGTGGAGGGAGTGGAAGEGTGGGMDASSDARDAAAEAAASDAGSLSFMPSNIDPSMIDWTKAIDVTGSFPNPVGTIAQNDGNSTLADLYVFKSLTVDSTRTLSVTGTRPVIIVVLNGVDIQGKINVTAGAFTGNAGGGPGTGQGGVLFPSGWGAGGGSYCGVGGSGSASAPPIAMGGMTYGEVTLRPLRGGSAGGNLGADGGGALAIIAGKSITVREFASINAGGNGSTGNPVGGGSGGAILLEAPVVTIAGVLAANGGGGGGNGMVGVTGLASDQPAPGGGAIGDAGAGTSVGGSGSAGAIINGGDGTYVTRSAGGGGGAGRIRINTMSGSATITSTATVSPGFETGCATQATLM